MEIKIETLEVEDLQAVERLGTKNSKTLGFFPTGAFEEHLKRGWVIGAKQEDKLCGYILFHESTQRFRLAHLCVDDAWQGKGIAARLFEELKGRGSSQTEIRLHCRRDVPAYDL
ncbi:MAG: GNAT family N-acetyltransferase [Verrucomicrobiota bacterium]